MTENVTPTSAHVKKIHGLIQCVLNAAGGFYGTDVEPDSLNHKPSIMFQMSISFLSVSQPLTFLLDMVNAYPSLKANHAQGC